MAETLKVLAQSNPAATTLTDIYTVPAATATVISSIMVANAGANTTFRLSIAVGGAANTAKQYLIYDLSILANTTTMITGGISMAAGDVLRVYAGTTSLSFNVFGVESA